MRMHYNGTIGHLKLSRLGFASAQDFKLRSLKKGKNSLIVQKSETLTAIYEKKLFFVESKTLYFYFLTLIIKRKSK